MVHCKYLEDVTNHFDNLFGHEANVLHEIQSPTIHVDVLVYQPKTDIPYLTLVTSGMSDKPMTTPEGMEDPEDYELAELVAFLPPTWQLPEYGMENDPKEANTEWRHMPVSCLKYYARMPHELSTMITVGQTAAEEGGEPIAKGTAHSGFLFAPAMQLGDAMVMRAKDGRRINLINLVSLNPDELNYAIENGGWELMEKLDKAQNFVFDPNRKSCLKRKKMFGL